MTRFAPGDAVQTPFGKGVVERVGNGGRLIVRIHERALVVEARLASPLARPPRPVATPAAGSLAAPAHVPGSRQRPAPSAVDLHGLTVDEALARIDDALDAALRAGLSELRFIHGRSGGKLRGALHQRLRAIAAVRGLRLDPRNAGVTIVSL